MEYKSRVVTVGGHDGVRQILVGGDNPVTLQTMWKDTIVDVKDNPAKLQEIIRQINTLKSLGCDIEGFGIGMGCVRRCILAKVHVVLFDGKISQMDAVNCIVAGIDDVGVIAVHRYV